MNNEAEDTNFVYTYLYIGLHSHKHIRLYGKESSCLIPFNTTFTAPFFDCEHLYDHLKEKRIILSANFKSMSTQRSNSYQPDIQFVTKPANQYRETLGLLPINRWFVTDKPTFCYR